MTAGNTAVADTPARRRVLAIVAGVLLVAGIVAVVVVSRQDAIDRAIEIVEDDTAFERGDDAGAAFARISTALRRGGEDCERDSGPSDVTCDALFAGAAYAQVAAVTVLECKRPGIFEARATMRSYLEELREAPSAKVPNLTRCT